MARPDRLTERLGLKEFQLKALLEVTKAINANTDRAGLLRLFSSIVHQELGITRLMLFERTDRWRLALGLGTGPEPPAVDLDELLAAGEDVHLTTDLEERRLGGFDVVVPVFHEQRPLACLLIGDLDEEERRMSPTVKHLNFIQTLTNLIVVALENKRLAAQALQQERDKRELELAAEMQGMLVPRELPRTGRFEAAAWYQPHGQVGGDHYDVVHLGDRMVLVVADVSGKGMAAALLMSNFQATLRALLEYAHGTLDELVRDLNDKVYGNARGERFITCFLAELDLPTGAMRYVNAGHNPVLLRTDRGFTDLTAGSIALGMMPKLPFLHLGAVAVPPGGLLLAYTDGLVEQEDGHGRSFDLDQVRRVIDEVRHAGPSAVVEAVTARFEAHRGDQPYLDDIALLSCVLR